MSNLRFELMSSRNKTYKKRNEKVLKFSQNENDYQTILFLKNWEIETRNENVIKRDLLYCVDLFLLVNFNSVLLEIFF